MKSFIPLLISTCLATGCQEPPINTPTYQQDTLQYEQQLSTESSNDIVIKIDSGSSVIEAGCVYKDGKHPAAVTYFNPKTGHSAKHELEVHVEDCKIVRINFPNGGWLDEDHIPRTPINSNREAVFKDDKGRQWNVQLHIIP